MAQVMFKALHYGSIIFKTVHSLPVISRIVDVASTSMVAILRGASGVFTASGLEQCKRPQKLLKLYEFEGCPYCRKVREALSVLDLDVMVYPCPRETLKAYGVCDKARYRPEVTKLGGQQSYPFFVDENTGVKMNGSADIVAYLWKTYGQNAKPPLTYKIGQMLDNTPAFMLPALCRPMTTHGTLRVPSKLPKEPLVLWGCEGSPFVKMVREVLCCLEIPYKLINVAHGSDAKRLEFRKKYGNMLSTVRAATSKTTVQMPLLVDPNTGIEMLESASIAAYLWETYQDGPVSLESWTDYTTAKAPELGQKKD